MNPSTEQFCLACNSRLGYVRPSDRPDAEASTSRYRQIRLRCEEVQSGHITMQAFAAYLQELSNILQQRGQAIYDNLELTEYYADNADEVDMGIGGVQSYEAGVNELWAFVEDGNAAHIEDGLLLIWEGNQRIIEAMRINRESREELSLLWEQLQGG